MQPAEPGAPPGCVLSHPTSAPQTQVLSPKQRKQQRAAQAAMVKQEKKESFEENNPTVSKGVSLVTSHIL